MPASLTRLWVCNGMVLCANLLLFLAEGDHRRQPKRPRTGAGGTAECWFSCHSPGRCHRPGCGDGDWLRDDRHRGNHPRSTTGCTGDRGRSDHQKLELAKQLGASDTIHSTEEDLHTRLMELTGGMGPDVVIEAVGSPATYRMAIDEVAFTGRVVCIGYAKSEVSFETKYFVSKELDIRGSRNALPEDFRAVIAYMQRNQLPASLITAVYPPEEADKALLYWSENRDKVLKIILAFE